MKLGEECEVRGGVRRGVRSERWSEQWVGESRQNLHNLFWASSGDSPPHF